ncbi:MAG: hypothetical protein IT304_10870 [Dehalococcoidia bacterium]|nr:hypothetical protein [Dehalococcoidia bacterium]
MLAPPIAWAFQLLVGYGVAAQACEGRVSPIDPILHGITAAALVATMAALAAALYEWAQIPHPAEGVRLDRARFMALCGILLSTLFLILIVFTDIPPFFLEHGCAAGHG